VSNQSKPNTYGGYMVRLDFTKRDSITTLSDSYYTLYWVSRPPTAATATPIAYCPLTIPTRCSRLPNNVCAALFGKACAT